MPNFDDSDFNDEETLLGFENAGGAGLSPKAKGPFTKELFTMPPGITLKESSMDDNLTPETGSESEKSAPPSVTESEAVDSTLEIPMEDFEDLAEDIDAAQESESPAEPTQSEELDKEVLRDAIKDLLAKVQSLNEEINEERNRKLRIAADMENLKKRTGKNQEIAVNRAKTDVIVEFLPVVDHLEMALAHVDDSKSVEALKEGVLMVLKQFNNSLSRFGVESLDALGEQFDPNYHEAMAQEESELYGAGMVISQWQKGYKLGDMLIRPARVVVSKGPGPQGEQQEPPQADPEGTE